MEACDLYGRCATTAGETALAEPRSAGGEILRPPTRTVLTSTEAITITGDAYAASGLKNLVVQVNERAAFTNHWSTDEVTEESWSFIWTPPGEGIYRFVPLIVDWGDETVPDYTDSPAVTGDEPEAVEVPDMPPSVYLPLMARDGSPVHARSGGSGPTVLYLPLIEKAVNLTGSYTGTEAIIYVDLAPPVVTLDKNEWKLVDAIGPAIIELTGAISDSVAVHRVDVRINDGPWERAGFADGRWHWPWFFGSTSDRERFTVSVRAIDLAGHTGEISEEVIVDTVARP